MKYNQLKLDIDVHLQNQFFRDDLILKSVYISIDGVCPSSFLSQKIVLEPRGLYGRVNSYSGAT